jgi:hypothetical protein
MNTSVATNDLSRATELSKHISETETPPWESVTAVASLLGHPNPRIRDDLVYPTLARAVLDGKLDAALPQLATVLTGPAGTACDEELDGRIPILARSFSVLILASVINRARATGLPLRDLAPATSELERLLSRETDLRSWDDRYGWIHIVAHLGDCVDELFEWDIDEELAARLVRGLVSVLVRRADGLFAFGEYDRLAYALATALLRDRITALELEQIIDAPQEAAREFQSPPETVVRANHLRSLVRALSWQLEKRDAPPELRETLTRINLALQR